MLTNLLDFFAIMKYNINSKVYYLANTTYMEGMKHVTSWFNKLRGTFLEKKY